MAFLQDDPAAQAADVHQFAETGTSIFDSASDFVTKGVPLAVASGLHSMYDTALALGNSLGGDFERNSFESKVREYDDDLSKYYTEHKEGIDLGGFAATSFIPGVAGLKALKVIQAGGFGKNAAAATSLFKSAEERYLKKALSSVQAETNTVFKSLNGDKIAAIAAGFGEQALQAAAFETAIMVTMNQNPTINKEDSGYFQTLLYSAPEVFKGALLGGAIGGGLNAIGISGQIKSAIRARDKSDFPSLNLKELGVGDLAREPGSAIALDYSWLQGRKATLAAEAKAGNLNERQVKNYEDTIKQKETEIRYRLMNELAGGDADLGNSMWLHLTKLPESAQMSSQDVALSLLGAATKAERITFEDATASSLPKILSKDDTALGERHARKILERGKIAPNVISPADGPALEEAKMLGHELFKDSAGNLRVIPGITYEGKLAQTIDKAKHSFIVKLAGDDAGRITETAFPVAGDLGKVKLTKGELFINDERQANLPYDPSKHGYLDSHLAFVREDMQRAAKKALGKAIKEDSDDVFHEIDFQDLPRIERAVREGNKEALVLGPDGEVLGEATTQILKDAKLQWRQELVNLGHSFDQIEREINVSREFAETGSGEFIPQIDYTQPLHSKLTFDTKQYNQDKNFLRGQADLRTRVEIATEHNKKVAAQIFREDYSRIPQLEGNMVGINTMPETGNMIASANGAYGSTLSFFQEVGKTLSELFLKRHNETVSRISAGDAIIRGDVEKTANLNLYMAKARALTEPAMLYRMEEGANKGKYLIPQSLLKQAAKEKWSPEKFDEALTGSLAKKNSVKFEDDDIFNYFQDLQGVNSGRVDNINAVFAAKGSVTQWDKDTFYSPPINTRKYDHVAFVQEKAATEFRPVSVITASDATSLEAKIRAVNAQYGDQLGVYTKSDIANFYKLRGEYENGLLLSDSTVDSSLKKMGVLSDFQPRTDSVILDDILNWHFQQEQQLLRNGAELQYAQQFAELRAMGKSFEEYQMSKFSRDLTDKELSQIKKDNPYEQYISTALAVSNYAKYDSVWGRFNSGVEGVGQSMFKIWDSVFNKANKGEISWEAANKTATELGFRPPFGDVLREVVNPLVTDRKIVEPLVAKVNATLATTILRLDPLNAIVNILGTPGLIAAELKSIQKNINNPDVVGKLGEMLTLGIPGTPNKIPSMTELIGKALTNFITDDGTKLAYYQKIGAVTDDLKLYKSVVDASQLTKDALGSDKGLVSWAADLAKSTAEFGSKLTGNQLSERMVRYVAADIMAQLGTAAKLTTDEMGAYINTFVNRVHGNYVSSQRPHLFQGAVGQAISLFQTYQFNVMQNMVRFVENNEKVSIAALLGMQNTLFGLQGNPAFYLLNSYIGNTNREHKDLVTGIHATVGEDVGKWLTYGLGSNALKVNLYNRGDLTPRYVTIVPTNLTDVPAVSIPAKFIGSMLGAVSQITKGAPISAAILDGIAHNGVNRPVAGMAQLAQGFRTTSSGNMLVAYNDWDTMMVAAKVLGGEEMNRAVAIDGFYRQQAYKVKDRENITAAGEVLKQKIRAGVPLVGDELTNTMQEYARSGGRIENFNSFVLQNQKHANKSQISVMKNSLGSTYAKNLSTIMGAEDEQFLYGQPPAPGPVENAQTP